MVEVTTKAPGSTAHNAVKPGHTPTLLEIINYRGPSAETLQRQFQQEVKDSQKHRKGERVPMAAPAPDTSWIKGGK